MSALTLSGLAKRFGTTWAVHEASFVVPSGAFATILGPSGCGKTTILRMIGGFETPDRGDIVIGDTRMNTTPPWRRGLGIVFQSYALFPFMTVFDNVAFGLRRRKSQGNVEGRVRNSLQLVGMQDYEGRYPRQLSGGQQQRVAIARALAVEPKVLLLDEPLSSLDAELRGAMRSELKRIQQTTGVTTVLVTHDQEEALSLSDTMIIMNQGRVITSGTPRDIWRQPRDSFVADFLGVENLLPGTAVAEGAVKLERGPVASLLPHAADRSGPLILGIRSEDVAILDTDAAPPADAAFVAAGTIRQAAYRGTLVSYQIETSLSDHPIVASASAELAIGARVQLAFPRQKLMRLAAQGNAS